MKLGGQKSTAAFRAANHPLNHNPATFFNERYPVATHADGVCMGIA